MKSIFKLVTIALLAGSLTSCESKVKEAEKICDCSNKTFIAEVTNLAGTVNFNADVNEWYIAVHKENTIDEVLLFIPCNMEATYKWENKKVLFSGKTYALSEEITGVPAGYSYICVELSAIIDLPQEDYSKIRACNVENVLTDLPWLKEYIEKQTTQGDFTISIFQCTYQDGMYGMYGFWIQPETCFSDISYLCNCKGTVLFDEQDPQGASYEDWNIKNVTRIWTIN
jgi:hypothetical protein